MKFIYLSFMLVLLSVLDCSAQNCFNEFDNVVSDVACVDYSMGFDVNVMAAKIGSPNQPLFTTTTNEGFTKLAPSWFMMDKSGKLFNIHQYGFKTDNDLNIVVVYKVLVKDKSIEAAITIEGKPVYHGITNLSIDKYGYYRTPDLNGGFDFKSSGLLIVLNDKSQLVCFAFGGYVVYLKN